MVISTNSILVTIVVVTSVLFQIVSPTNLCSTAGLCCKHRDSECVAQKVFPNHTVDTSQLPCYCDHACLRLDDCCPDYKHFCAGMTFLNNSFQISDTFWPFSKKNWVFFTFCWIFKDRLFYGGPMYMEGGHCKSPDL